jgi:hypothetical protein
MRCSSEKICFATDCFDKRFEIYSAPYMPNINNRRSFACLCHHHASNLACQLIEASQLVEEVEDDGYQKSVALCRKRDRFISVRIISDFRQDRAPNWRMLWNSHIIRGLFEDIICFLEIG